MHKLKTNDDFYFSIIMAVYNVEDYLKEAIESLVNQSIGFEQHVQLILVNDGSVDQSGKICEQYKEIYPNNIIYISKENGGVSSSRNEGIDVARGRFINFLDPDDKLSENTLEYVYNFFENHGVGIDVTSIPIHWFDQSIGAHLLNYKYNSNRIINIFKEYHSIQMSASSSFIRRQAVGNIRFKETLKYGEDAEWLNRIILNKCEYGVVKEPIYHYRKRSVNTSATQQALKDKDYYLLNLSNFSFSLIELSLEKLGFVPKYIQYMLMYDLQWRLNNNDLSITMTEKEREDFLSELRVLLSHIDDSIILQQKHLNLYRKNYLLRLKANQEHNEFYHQFSSPSTVLMMHSDRVMDVMENHKLAIELLNIEDDYLILEGHFLSMFDNNKINLFAIHSENKIIEAEKVERFYKNINIFGETIIKAIGFKFKIPLQELNQKFEVSFYINYMQSNIPLELMFGEKNYLTEKHYSFYHKHGYLVSFNKKRMQIIVNKSNLKLHWKKELVVLKDFYKRNKIGSRKAVVGRLNHFMLNQLKKRPVWLFMDRVNKADDNAEVLFEYAVKQNDGIDKFFVINKDSDDYQRLQKIGQVIPYGSRKHKMYMLQADKLISSHVDEFILNPFGKMKKYYRDLLNYDFIFLQHGITKDDISDWLNKYKKNIRLFITAANKEYESILHGHYDYEERNVLLSGFPRFDKLKDDNQKRILIMPTWRSDLVAKINPATGKRKYNPVFKESKYFKAFNDLLNNEKLILSAKENGYTIVFFPHPNISQQLKDFTIDPSIEVADLTSRYRDHFNQSSLLVTDYSSVAFDFAYLKKPVIYYQFEMNHLAEGYFDYLTMGFGDVLAESENVANRITDYIEKNCQMEPEYKKRVDQFYSYTDHDNCKRVYEAIKEVNKVQNQ